MERPQATTAIFIDKYHPKVGSRKVFLDKEEKQKWLKKNGVCAISIRVTYKSKKRYYATPVNLSVPDFEKTRGEKPREPFKSIALQLHDFEKKAADIIKGLPIFTWDKFEQLYFTDRGATESVSSAFDEYIKSLEKEGRLGTASSYTCAKNSLDEYKKDLKFVDITSTFLREYEAKMKASKKSITTVGIYLRSLRTIFNIAISYGHVSKDLYPFGKRKYDIPTGKNIKKALNISEVEQIFNYKPSPWSMTDKAKDYWVFSYLCNGINIKDICLLKYENLNGNILEFTRSKTVLTKRTVTPIRAIMTDDLKNIIEKWGNINKENKNYIFQELTEGLNLKRQRKIIQQLTKNINHHMDIIGKELNIPTKITTYVARHTYSTILRRSGKVSDEYIGDSLGHGDSKTTRAYFASFEDDLKVEAAKALTDFIKKTG